MVCRHWVFLRISKHQHLAQESEKQQENLVEGEAVSAVAATPHSEESQQRSGSLSRKTATASLPPFSSPPGRSLVAHPKIQERKNQEI